MATCTCKLCIESHHFFDVISTLPNPEDRKWMEALYEKINYERFDANYNEAIIDGSWPNADDIIEQQRKNNKKGNNGYCERKSKRII